MIKKGDRYWNWKGKCVVFESLRKTGRAGERHTFWTYSGIHFDDKWGIPEDALPMLLTYHIDGESGKHQVVLAGYDEPKLLFFTNDNNSPWVAVHGSPDLYSVLVLVEAVNAGSGVDMSKSSVPHYVNDDLTVVDFEGYVVFNPVVDKIGRITYCDFVVKRDGSFVDSSEFYRFLKEYNSRSDAKIDYVEGEYESLSMKDVGFFAYLDAVFSNPRYVKFEDWDFIYVNPRVVYKDGKVVRDFGLYDGNGAKSSYKVDGDGSIIYTQGYKTRDEALKNPLHSFTGGPGYTLEYDYKLSVDGKIIEDFTKPSEAGLMDFMYVR